ncbi:membrane magnesium transporter 2 isoform X1 [Mus musculus]|uniref:membrane magnesium transporter 2 isoform X1 n=1 Tax=Mus musculus TaxID=10090 RepID=UPI0011AE45DA|nr:membrane magnesium transporter 2 isoform X1 [Mus musculus]
MPPPAWGCARRAKAASPAGFAPPRPQLWGNCCAREARARGGGGGGCGPHSPRSSLLAAPARSPGARRQPVPALAASPSAPPRPAGRPAPAPPRVSLPLRRPLLPAARLWARGARRPRPALSLVQRPLPDTVLRLLGPAASWQSGRELSDPTLMYCAATGPK